MKKINLPLIKWESFDRESLRIDNEVHIFKASVAEDEKYKHLYADVLSEEEQLKAARFKREIDQRSYKLRRYLLRELLSIFTGILPADIRYQKAENKKPVIDGIAFNSSHSGTCILTAIAPVPVGIDVEQVLPEFDFSILLDSCFTASELDFIDMGQASRDRFYQLWTRKEAVLKANGSGLTDHLNELDCLSEEITFRNQDYLLKTANIDNSYTLSVALNARSLRINYWTF